MTREEAFTTVQGMLVEHLGVDAEEVTPTASFKGDFEADSLDLVELVMELEDHFALKISDEEARQMERVGDVVDFVVERS